MAKYAMEVRENPKGGTTQKYRLVDFEAQDDQEAENIADALAGPCEIMSLYRKDKTVPGGWVTV